MHENLKLLPVITGELTDSTPVPITLGDPRYIRVQVATGGEGVLVRPPGDSTGYAVASGGDTNIFPYTGQTVTLVRNAGSGTATYTIWRWVP